MVSLTTVTSSSLSLTTSFLGRYGNRGKETTPTITSYARFSHDRGSCFKSEDLDTTGSFKVTKGLLMDPLGLGMFAFALGLEGTDINDMWRLIAINFHSVLDSPCKKRIMETSISLPLFLSLLRS